MLQSSSGETRQCSRRAGTSSISNRIWCVVSIYSDLNNEVNVSGWLEAMRNGENILKELQSAVENLEKSLYHQKHAFYFRKVKQWSTCLSVSDSFERN